MTPMRRKDRALDRAAALEIAERCEYAVLSMVDPAGAPYCVPLSIATAAGEDGKLTVYFHAAAVGFKLDCLKANARVCLLCVGETERLTDEFSTKYESAILRGVAHAVVDDTEKIAALRLICERHTPAHMHAFDEAIASTLFRTAVWAIDVDEITGKARR